MRYIKTYDLFEFKKEFEYKKEKLELVKKSDMTRYLLHVSDVDNRNSILKYGLVPRLPNKKWSLLGKKEGFEKSNYWTRPAIFATKFKDEIDVYDVKEIGRYVFPLHGLGDDSDIMSFVEYLEANKLEYVPRKRNKKDTIEDTESHSDWYEEMNAKYNNYVTKNSRFDIWLIDTNKIPGMSWYKDQAHYYDSDSVLCLEKIPSEAIELFVEENKEIVVPYNESLNRSRAPLYHVTFLHKTLDIINNDALMNINDVYKMKHPDLYKDDGNLRKTISLTRDKDYKYQQGSVTLTLDGEKLSQKFKMDPFDYYNIKNNDKIAKGDPRRKNYTKEFEEALHGSIKNLHKYLIKISLNPSVSREAKDVKDDVIPKIEDYCKKYNIEFEK